MTATTYQGSTPADTLLKPVDAGARLNMDQRALRRLPLPFIKLSPHCTRYRLSDIEKFIADRSQGAR
jgi:hypothetical protein